MKTITCCPHCKERPVTQTTNRFVNTNHKPKLLWFVECPFCEMNGPLMETLEGAIDAWNAIADVIESGDAYSDDIEEVAL